MRQPKLDAGLRVRSVCVCVVSSLPASGVRDEIVIASPNDVLDPTNVSRNAYPCRISPRLSSCHYGLRGDVYFMITEIIAAVSAPVSPKITASIGEPMINRKNAIPAGVPL